MNSQLWIGAKHWANHTASSRWWMVIAGMLLTFRIGADIERVSVLFCEDIYTDSVSSEKATKGTEMDQTAWEWRMRREEKLKGSPRGTRAHCSGSHSERRIGRMQLSKLWLWVGGNAPWVSAVRIRQWITDAWSITLNTTQYYRIPYCRTGVNKALANDWALLSLITVFTLSGWWVSRPVSKLLMVLCSGCQHKRKNSCETPLEVSDMVTENI